LDFLAKGDITTALECGTRAEPPDYLVGQAANHFPNTPLNTLNEIKQRVITWGLKGPIRDPAVQSEICFATLVFRPAKFFAGSQATICLEGQKVSLAEYLCRLSISKEAFGIQIATRINPQTSELVPLPILSLQVAGKGTGGVEGLP
jgi:hypothetical protein